MVKRIFDIVFSFFLLILLFPALILISIFIVFDSKGGVFYFQERIGKSRKPFKLMKFRTMVTGADQAGLITIGERDSRITRIGFWLRKYKLDELPQLLNILIGEMSVVGPRPEVAKYVALYTNEQLKVLSVKPGLTDYASIKFVDESAILSSYADPEKAYVEKILPEKLNLNLQYIAEANFFTDLKIIFKTIGKIIR